jgi:hypothetical protein
MARWKVPIAVAFAIGMLMPIVRGQEPHKSGAGSPKPMPLTAMDYVEIRQLVSRYAFAVDTGTNNGYDYADLFQPTVSSCGPMPGVANSWRRSRAAAGSVRPIPCTTS